MIYLFISAHVKRVIGSMSALRYKAKHAYYAQDKQGNFVRKGGFNTARPVLSLIYKTLRKSRILKSFNMDIPRITNSHIELTAKAIKNMRNQYYREFGNNNFYVFIKSGSKIGKRLATELNIMGIENFNIQSIFANRSPKYKLSKNDGHPSALAQKMMAEKIVNDLKLGSGQ